MLAPEINDTKAKLTDSYRSIVSLDNFATTSFNLTILKLPKDPDWLPPVRGEVATLNKAAGDWRLARPGIWAPVLVSFTDYTSSFAAVAAAAKAGSLSSSEEWIAAINQTLLPTLGNCLTTTRQVETQLQSSRAEFSDVLPQIDKSIQAGWDALESEEQDMLRLATELGGLNELLQGLGAKLDSDAISGDKGILQSAVSLLYAAGAAGAEASIPVLGIVIGILSIGKSFYDIIKDNQDLIGAMNRINAVKAELSDDALGVALTKSTLQTLYQLEESFLASRDPIPGLIDLWTGEKSKVEDAIDALQAGVHPNQYLNLLTLQAAQANWQAIQDYVSDLAHADITVGQPVTIDIGKAEIRPTLTD